MTKVLIATTWYSPKNNDPTEPQVTPTVNTIILETGQWPLRVSQMFGYFPISIKKTGRDLELQVKRISCPWLVLTIFVLVSIFTGITYSLSLEEVFEFSSYVGPKHHTFFVLVYYSWTTCVVLLSTCSRLQTLLNQQGICNLFRDFVEIVEFVISIFKDQNVYEFLKGYSLKLAKKGRNLSIIYIFVGTLSFYYLNLVYLIALKVPFSLMNLIDTLLCVLNLSQFFSIFPLLFLVEYYKLILDLILTNGFKSHGDWVVPMTSVMNLLNCFNKMEEQIQAFNKVFGTRILIDAFYSLVQLIFLCYFLFITTLIGKVPLGVFTGYVLPVAVLGYSLFLVCKASSQLSEKCLRFLQQLGKLDLTKMDSKTIAKVIIWKSLSSNSPWGVKPEFTAFDCRFRKFMDDPA